ncbi:MAG: rRNA maturation RNase YbeY [Terrimicrobiaceae bacterium]
MIRLEISNRQRGVAFDLRFLTRMARAAHPSCLASIRKDPAPLAGLTAIEATILSDRRIAQVHREFFDDPTPTDVITFHHGEILLGAGVVAENAERFGRSVDEEAALCLIHGMLHLAGWDDLTPADAKRMAERQEQIFQNTLAGC